jgi:polygalacturonase
MADGHGGVVIGSEISGGFSNLFVEDCEMDSPELLRVIRIKTSDCRGGVVENVNVRNVTVGKCSEAVLKIILMYEPGEECDRNFPPFVRDVTLENVTSCESQYGIYIIGLDGAVNVSDITLRNCSFNGVQEGASVTGAEGVKLRKVFVNGEKTENLSVI